MTPRRADGTPAERLAPFNGRLQVQSRPRHGMLVAATLPNGHGAGSSPA